MPDWMMVRAKGHTDAPVYFPVPRGQCCSASCCSAVWARLYEAEVAEIIPSITPAACGSERAIGRSVGGHGGEHERRKHPLTVCLMCSLCSLPNPRARPHSHPHPKYTRCSCHATPTMFKSHLGNIQRVSIRRCAMVSQVQGHGLLSPLQPWSGGWGNRNKLVLHTRCV
jgi:hypothetical protein